MATAQKRLCEDQLLKHAFDIIGNPGANAEDKMAARTLVAMIQHELGETWEAAVLRALAR